MGGTRCDCSQSLTSFAFLHMLDATQTCYWWQRYADGRDKEVWLLSSPHML